MVDDYNRRRGVARNHASEKTPQRIGILSSNRSGLSQIAGVTSGRRPNRPNQCGGIEVKLNGYQNLRRPSTNFAADRLRSHSLVP
jgi:hypothetical protein